MAVSFDKLKQLDWFMNDDCEYTIYIIISKCIQFFFTKFQ